LLEIAKRLGKSGESRLQWGEAKWLPRRRRRIAASAEVRQAADALVNATTMMREIPDGRGNWNPHEAARRRLVPRHVDRLVDVPSSSFAAWRRRQRLLSWRAS
jgi:hypothetical protein